MLLNQSNVVTPENWAARYGLRSCEQRFDLLQNLMNAGYFEFDPLSKELWFSDGMYRLFEMTKETTPIHYPVRHLIYPADWSLYKQKLKDVLSGKAVSGHIRIKTRKNNLQTVRFAASRKDSFFPSIVGAVIQEEAFAENEALDTAAELAHDIKQPLQAVMLLSEDLETAEQSERNEILRNLKSAGEYLNRLLENILNNSKQQNKINRRFFNLKNLLEKLTAEYQKKAARRGIKFELQTTDYQVFQDELLTERILRNLLENALKYAQTKIIFRNTKTDVFVADDGNGIKKSEQKQIFERFYRCKIPETEQGGFGLGLSIVAQIAACINAEIRLKSAEGKGTVFKIHL